MLTFGFDVRTIEFMLGPAPLPRGVPRNEAQLETGNLEDSLLCTSRPNSQSCCQDLSPVPHCFSCNASAMPESLRSCKTFPRRGLEAAKRKPIGRVALMSETPFLFGLSRSDIPVEHCFGQQCRLGGMR